MLTINITNTARLEIDPMNITLCIDITSKNGKTRTERSYFNNVASALTELRKLYMDSLGDELVFSLPEYIEWLKLTEEGFKKDILDALGGNKRFCYYILGNKEDTYADEE